MKVVTPLDIYLFDLGRIIEVPSKTETTFSADHFSYWKQQGILDTGTPIEIGILQVQKNTLPVEKMERHDHTPELLVPLTGDFIICVAPKSGERPEAKNVKSFRINRGQAIILNKSCWHWMPSPIESDITIMVVFKNNTSAEDLIIADLDEPCIIDNRP